MLRSGLHSPLYLSAHGISVHFWSLQGIKKKAELPSPSFKIDIYSQEESFACEPWRRCLVLFQLVP